MDLDDLSFSELVLLTPGVALVAFGVPALLAYRELRRELPALAREFEGRAQVHHVDAALQRAVVTRAAVETLPTVIVFRHGAELGRLVGAHPVHHYRIALASALEAPPGAEQCLWSQPSTG